MPLLIPMTATIDSVRHLLNDPVVNFALPDYIASEFSPHINYNLVTSTDFTSEDMEYLKKRIDEIAQIKDYDEKKKAITEIKAHIEEHLAKF